MREPLELVEKICLALLGTLFIAALGFGGYLLHDAREQITESEEQITESEEQITELKIEIENTDKALILITEELTRVLNEHTKQISSNSACIQLLKFHGVDDNGAFWC